MNAPAITVLAEALGRSRFRVVSVAAAPGRHLAVDVPSSFTPFLDAARALLAQGVDPATPMQGQVQAAAGPGFVSTVGKAAALAIFERSAGGLRFGHYVPFAPDAITRAHGDAQDGDSEVEGTPTA